MPTGSAVGGPSPAIRGWLRAASLAVTLNVTVAVTLATPAGAQSLQAECPPPPDAPVFVTQTVEALGNLRAHTERWQEPLHWHRLLRELDRLRFDGLSPQNYLVSALARIADQLQAGIPPTPCQSALASLALTWSLSDLSWGRLDPQELGVMWHQTPERPTPEAFAVAIHRDFYDDQGLRQAYQVARPAIAPYQALRLAYREAYRQLPESWPLIPSGPTLREGDRGPRVTALSRRLAAQGYLERSTAAQSTTGNHASDRGQIFGGELATAVMAFQRDHGLDVDGLVGATTLETLNIAPGAWNARTRANLERLRWIAPYYADHMVLVDIAGARVSIIHDGHEVWTGNAQVGRPERKTPALTSFISHVTINPTWTIPPTVFHEDTLPAIQSDPDYLSRNQVTVLNRSGTQLNPEDVDWSHPGDLVLRQAAGPDNALGEVAIRFANPFSVYLHDTPSRWLFDTPDRFYSSGCVRVEDAVDLSDRLLAGASEKLWQQIRELRRYGETRNVYLPDPIRLVMAYWTAEGGPHGRVRYRPDTYEEDRLVIDLLDKELR